MTMRLDIVTNDAGELVRREHARELGAGVVVAIYRLAKLAQMHDLGNQAFLRQLEQTHQMIGEYCLRSGGNVNVLFADKATFVAGQLLKGNRGAYEAAAELGALLERIGGSELNIAREVTREDLHAFAEQLSAYHRTNNVSQLSLPPTIHLRQVADAARLRGIELEDLTPDQRIVRAYASAVVIMRRFFDDLAASRYVLPRRIKRIAQSLVDLSDARASSFLGVTEVRNANHDEAGRSVNTAILAVSMARESTEERTTLAQIAMAAMMHDVARPRALALAGAGGAPMPGMAGPSTLSEDQEDRLASGAAAVLTALGRVNEPSITRTVLTFEALWLRRKTWLGPVYWGARPATLHATIIAVARRYNDLLTPEPGLQPPTTDYAVATLANELTDPQDRTVLRMLVSALGLLPTGTVVQLSTGEVAEVVRGSKGLGDKPRVLIVADVNGSPYAQPVELELSQDPRRTVLRVLSVDGWSKGLEEGPRPLAYDHDDEPDAASGLQPHLPAASPAAAPAPSPAAPRVSADARDSAANRRAAVWDEPRSRQEHVAFKDRGSSISGEHSGSASLPSLGSTPSSVAEAMGRILDEPLAAPAHREAERADRTLFQPQGAGEAPSPRVVATARREATARGNLATTPLPHVLVYMLDHALTGSVVFEGTASDAKSADTIYFVDGVPAKVRLRETVALLGDVLVQEGSLDAHSVDSAVEGARRLGILLGEYLVGHDLVLRDALAWGLQAQLLRKIAHVANLAPEIEYTYFRDVDFLDDWGGDILVSHPLNPILASVRHWNDRARVRATLQRIGQHPLTIHPDSDLATLEASSEEQIVLEAMRVSSLSLSQLFAEKLAPDEVVSSLVYTFAVTRQFAFDGQKKGPMAARGGKRRGLAPLVRGVPPAAGAKLQPATRPVAPPPSAAALAPSAPGSSRALGAPGRPAVAGAVRPGAPQIRPISVKKATMVGIQPGAPVQGPPSSPELSPQAANAPRAGTPGALPAPVRPPVARTAASPAPAIAGSDLVPNVTRESPFLAEKGTAGGGELRRVTGALGGPSKVATTVRGVAPAPMTEGVAPVEIVRAKTSAGDDELAAAEASLEAMSNFRLAETALERNEVAAAEVHAKRAVEGDPTHTDYLTLLAWIRALDGSPKPVEDAIRIMSKVLIEDPSNEKALFYRGKLLVRTNRLAEALNDFTELLSANPDHREAKKEADDLKTKVAPD